MARTWQTEGGRITPLSGGKADGKLLRLFCTFFFQACLVTCRYLRLFEWAIDVGCVNARRFLERYAGEKWSTGRTRENLVSQSCGITSTVNCERKAPEEEACFCMPRCAEKRRRCKYCSLVRKMEARTDRYCAVCKVPLCVSPLKPKKDAVDRTVCYDAPTCFESYHDLVR